MIYLQNKVTGEISEFEPDTQEYREAIAQRTEDGKPVFEQQSDAAVAAKIERAEKGTLRESDLPKDSQADKERNDVRDFSAEHRPWENLTDAEVALGLTPERKAEESAKTLDSVRQGKNAEAHANAAAKIAGSDTSRRGGAGVVGDMPPAIDGDGNGHGESDEDRKARERDEAEAAKKRAAGEGS